MKDVGRTHTPNCGYVMSVIYSRPIHSCNCGAGDGASIPESAQEYINQVKDANNGIMRWPG